MVEEISVLAVTNIGRDMEDLAQAIQAEDWSEVRRLSHRMKGAAASSGAQRMSAMAPGWKIKPRPRRQAK